MAKQKIRNAGNRSNGGRKRQDGDRYPNGRLKPAGPNQLMVDRRKAICEDVTKASNPLDAAHYRGWLSSADFDTGQRFARLHSLAGFGQRGGGAGAGREVAKPTEVSLDVALEAKSFFSGLPHAEIVGLWDSVFDDDGVGRTTRDDRAAKAMVSWKAANAAMSPAQRAEVHLVCIEQSFPQWVIQRAAGHMDSAWEAKRALLIGGLQAIRQALKPARAAQPASSVIPDPVQSIAEKRVIEREIRVEEGRQTLEVERVSRRNVT